MSDKKYSAKFNRFFTDLLQREGGYAVLSGMPTNLGIEQRTYDAYRKSKNLPHVPVQNITYGDAKNLYFDMYWEPNQYEQLPDNISYIVADNAVNAGPTNANRILQSYVGTKADGIIGPKTIKAVQDTYKKNPSGLENQVLDGIMERYGRIAMENPEKAKYLKGWGNRVTAMRKFYVTTPDEILDGPAPGVKQGGGSLKDPSAKNVSGVSIKRNLNEPAVTNTYGQVIDKTKSSKPKRATKSGSLIYGGK